jgi:hypothetical protein
MSQIRKHIEEKANQVLKLDLSDEEKGGYIAGYLEGIHEGIRRAVTAVMPKDPEARNAALEQLKRDTIEIATIIKECAEETTA